MQKCYHSSILWRVTTKNPSIFQKPCGTKPFALTTA